MTTEGKSAIKRQIKPVQKNGEKHRGRGTTELEMNVFAESQI